MHEEPDIVINGTRLNSAQAGTVRVAIADFLMQLADPEEMELMGPVGPLYQARASEVQDIMLKVQVQDRA